MLTHCKLRLLAAAISMMTVVVLAGCGGGGDSDAPATGNDPAQPPSIEAPVDPPPSENDPPPLGENESAPVIALEGEENGKFSITSGSTLIARAQIVGIPTGSSVSWQLENSSGQFSLEPDSSSAVLTATTPSGQGSTTLATTIVASGDVIGGTIRKEVLIEVAEQTQTASEVIGSDGGTISGGTIGVNVSAGQLVESTEFSLSEANASDGLTIVTLDFNRDIQSEDIRISLDRNRATQQSEKFVIERHESAPNRAVKSEYPLNKTIASYPGYFLPPTVTFGGNQRIRATDLPLVPLWRLLYSGRPLIRRVSIYSRPDAALLTSDRTESDLIEIRESAARTGKKILPVLFVNGYTLGAGIGGAEGTWGQFPQLVSALSNSDREVVPFEFRWRTNASFRIVGSDLAEALIQIRQLTGQSANVVAHSFGGILIRTLLQGQVDEFSNFDAGYVQSVTTLGTPHSGIFDRVTTIGNSQFPAGQDAAFFAGCAQVTCHQSGESVLWAANADLKQVIDVGATGQLMSQLAETPLPPGLPFHVGIGLRMDQVRSGFTERLAYTDGDGLIKYLAQRLRPTTDQNSALRSCRSGLDSTSEWLLAAVAANQEPASFYPGQDASTAGYGHISQLSPNLFGIRNLSEAKVSCSAADSCTHGSFVLVRNILLDENSLCAGLPDRPDELTPTLLGSTVTITTFQPDLQTRISAPYSFEAGPGVDYRTRDASVLPGVSLVGSEIDIGAARITYRFVDNARVAPAGFNGPVIQLDPQVARIDTLEYEAGVLPPGGSVRITYDEDTIAINLQDVRARYGQSFVLRLNLVPPE